MFDISKCLYPVSIVLYNKSTGLGNYITYRILRVFGIALVYWTVNQ